MRAEIPLKITPVLIRRWGACWDDWHVERAFAGRASVTPREVAIASDLTLDGGPGSFWSVAYWARVALSDGGAESQKIIDCALKWLGPFADGGQR